ncbi:MAG: winged helix-turn-helix transcriptional regulator [Candidatus Thorarchaeota archaeon]
MFDVLAAKGTRQILEYISRNPNQTSSDIHHQLRSELTTATIYRRLKELELVGFIAREPPHSNSLILTERGQIILERYIRTQPELGELRRTRRAILHHLKEDPTVNVAELSERAQISSRTLNKELKELSEMGLVEIQRNSPASIPTTGPDRDVPPPVKLKSKKRRRGRPAKRHRLTRKGERIYLRQKQLEEEKVQEKKQESDLD